MIEKSRLKVAIVYEWFYRKGGAERVVEALLEIFPDADVYALSGDDENLLPLTDKTSPKYSFLQKFPFSKKLYRYFYFLMPTL
jgi:oligoribonuclease NrnB/cAMP/cGMP phosphodiesterase (DHH superfamily)